METVKCEEIQTLLNELDDLPANPETLAIEMKRKELEEKLDYLFKELGKYVFSKY